MLLFTVDLTMSISLANGNSILTAVVEVSIKYVNTTSSFIPIVWLFAKSECKLVYNDSCSIPYPHSSQRTEAETNGQHFADTSNVHSST